MKCFVWIVFLLSSSVSSLLSQWPPEVLLHRQGDRPGWFYHYIGGLGDWTGDGIDELAVISVSADYDTSVMDVWWGGTTLSPDPDTTVCFPDSVVCFQFRKTGDVTGDGVSDWVTWGGGHLLFFKGGRAQAELVQVMRVDASTVVIPGDISGDGIPDMIVGDTNWNHARGRLFVYLGTQTGLVGPVDSLEGTGAPSSGLGNGLIAEADMNGDGWGDFACTFNSWDTTVALFHPRPGNFFGDYELFYGWSRALIPGAYGSGRPALVIYCVSGYCVHLGGTGLDTIPDAVLTVPGNFLGSPPSYVGDVNHDGWGDWVAGSDGAFGGLGAFLLFLGGQGISNYSYWMVGVQGQDYWAMGKGMTGMGDVNGDGVDDFAMLCSRDTNGYEGSQLVVFAGDPHWSSVEEERRPAPMNTPVTICAYPNPTNSGTRIEIIGVPRGQAVVEIWNILGQRVWRHEERVAGDKIELIWDAKDARGLPVAAGVYFVQVIHHSTSLARYKLLITR